MRRRLLPADATVHVCRCSVVVKPKGRRDVLWNPMENEPSRRKTRIEHPTTSIRGKSARLKSTRRIRSVIDSRRRSETRVENERLKYDETVGPRGMQVVELKRKDGTAVPGSPQILLSFVATIIQTLHEDKGERRYVVRPSSTSIVDQVQVLWSEIVHR